MYSDNQTNHKKGGEIPRYFHNDLGLTCFYEHAIWFIPHFHPLFIFNPYPADVENMVSS